MSGGESTKHQMDTTTNTADAYLTEGDGTEGKSTDRAILNSYKKRPDLASCTTTKAVIIASHDIKARQVVGPESPVWMGSWLVKMDSGQALPT